MIRKTPSDDAAYRLRGDCFESLGQECRRCATTHDHSAFVRRLESGDDPQQRGLAAPVDANESHTLAWIDDEGDVHSIRLLSRIAWRCLLPGACLTFHYS